MRLCVFLSAVLAAVWVGADAATTFTVDNLLYTVTDEEALTVSVGRISSSSQPTGDIVIPSTVTSPDDGFTYDVTAITSMGFLSCTGVTSVYIPKSVIQFKGYNTFYGCTALVKVEFEEGSESMTWPSSCFSGCTALTTINIPSSLTTIDTYTFQKCTSIVTMTIPEGVETIGQSSFKNCTSLQKVSIGSTVTTVNHSAFGGCTALTDIYMHAEEVPACSNTNYSIFDDETLSSATLHVKSEDIAALFLADEQWAFTNVAYDVETADDIVDLNGSTDGTVTEEEAAAAYDLAYTSIDPNPALTEDDLDTEEYDVESLSTITITYDTVVSVIDTTAVIAYTATGDTVSSTAASEGSSVVITFDETIATAGEWMVKVPQGTIGNTRYVESEGAYGSANSELLLYYYVDPVLGVGTVTIEPADSATVDTLSSFTITFEDWTYAYPVDGADEKPYVKNEDGDVITEGTLKDKYSNYMPITLNSEISDAGTYYLVIPADIIYLQDLTGNMIKNDTLTFTYFIEEEDSTPVASTLYSLTIDPENGSTVDTLSAFSVTFNDYTSVNCTSYPYVYTDDGLTENCTVDGYTVYAKPSVSGNTIDFTLNKAVTENGTYYIQIKSGKVVLDNAASTEEDIIVTYTVDSTYVSTDTLWEAGEESGAAIVTVAMVNPAEGSTVDSLHAGDYVQFTIEPSDEVGYAFYKILSGVTGETHTSRSTLTYDSGSGYWQGEVVYDKAFTDSVYEVIVAAYASESDYNYDREALAEDTFYFYGGAEEYEYSDIELVSASPENESSIDNAELTCVYTFSGLVNINSETSFVNYGQGSTGWFSSITPGDGATTIGGTEYSTEWTLVVDASTVSYFLNDWITLTVVATDTLGRRVQGDQGEDDQTYFSFTYEVFEGVGLTVSPSDGSTLAELASFTVTYAAGASIASTWWYYPVLCDSEGDTIEVINDGISANASGDTLTLTLKDTVAVAGTYYLHIPGKAFTVNDGENYNSADTLTYYVTAEESGDGSEDGGADTGEDEDGETGDDSESGDDTGEDTESGEGSEDEGDETGPEEEEEETDGIYGVKVSSDGTYTVYTLTGMRVMRTTDASDVKSLPSGLYIINGKKVAVK